MKNMKISFMAFVSIVLLVMPGLTLANGDPAKGQEKAATCEACHGKTGISIDPIYPNLAGQHSSYLVKALSDYRSGDRTNPIMAGFAANLSNQDILDLAAWFSSQEGLEDLSIK
jgi:cytochrome c553